jgi:Uma2 family endonuclease
MNVPQMRMDKAAFLDWAETQEGRCELVGGRAVMMMRPVMAHAIITRNLLIGLDRRLDRGRWTVIPDFAIDVGPATLRAPDVVVVPAGGDLKSRATMSPVLLAEILSPSTATIDLGDKSSEYVALPSLLAYLVLAQDEPKAWLWLRGPDGFHAGSQVIAGTDATIAIPSFGLDIPMAEIYAGVT